MIVLFLVWQTPDPIVDPGSCVANPARTYDERYGAVWTGGGGCIILLS